MIRTQTGKWKRLAAQQSAEQGKNSFALLGPLLQYLVVGFFFLETTNFSLLFAFCVFSLAITGFSSPSLHPFPSSYPYFCGFYSVNTPRRVWNNNSKYYCLLRASFYTKCCTCIDWSNPHTTVRCCCPILQMSLQRHREVSHLSSVTQWQSGSRAHALNHATVLSFHLDWKGKKLKNRGEAALSETWDYFLSPLASQKHTVVICNTGMLRLRESQSIHFFDWYVSYEYIKSCVVSWEVLSLEMCCLWANHFSLLF